MQGVAGPRHLGIKKCHRWRLLTFYYRKWPTSSSPQAKQCNGETNTVLHAVSAGYNGWRQRKARVGGLMSVLSPPGERLPGTSRRWRRCRRLVWREGTEAPGLVCEGSSLRALHSTAQGGHRPHVAMETVTRVASGMKPFNFKLHLTLDRLNLKPVTHFSYWKIFKYVRDNLRTWVYSVNSTFYEI